MNPIFPPCPSIPEGPLRDAVRRAYALEGDWTPLPGERDRNFHLHGVDGGDYVVKVANPADPAAVLHLQNAAMRCLAEAWTAGTAPRPLETR
ncbi:MAG: hypothetical protein PVF68_17505, partial [Acidobacteriota bacterium]